MYEAMQATVSPDVIESLFAIAIGFAVAGLCASGYRLIGARFPSFRLLEAGPIAARLLRSHCSSSPPRI
jgi:hypothetical protein